MCHLIDNGEMVRKNSWHRLMRYSAGLIMVFVLAVPLPSMGQLSARTWEAKVVRVADGDSLEVEKDGQRYRIRLYGIDSPEYGQPGGQEAGRFTRTMVMSRTVTMKTMDKDRYGRTVALVWSGGRLVNRELVRNGWAWVYPKYCREQPLCKDLEALERGARKQELGLWREQNPLPPWRWKRAQGSRSSRDRISKRTALCRQ
jgi:micrococcal nuclease